MKTASSTPTSTETTRSSIQLRAAAIAAAVLTTSLLWLAAWLLDVELTVDQRNGQPPMDVGLPMVAGSTLAVCALGWGALAVLERFLSHARTIWTVLALAILALSLAAPIFSIEATAGTKTVLSLMHVAVAGVLVPMLGRNRPEGQQRHQ
ncbi:DUF6069 family protein [Micromonospora sp. NPDC006766]|uniref:DUF6069 family protein n=1 Tax=Micromonospora sp. NPDC006766 TaxID=3154778 RepID=UPI0033D80161